MVNLYEAITVIQFAGSVDRRSGQSRGHYTCDVKVKDKASQAWFRTNDSVLPVSIEPQFVSNLLVSTHKSYMADVLGRAPQHTV